MGQRITQRIYECSICEKIPENGEYMWHMGTEIWCEECCDKADQDNNENSKEKVIKVCEADCDNQPYDAEVNSHSYTFCCKKGFEKSLKEFAKTQGGRK